ncbi:unnamed protein product, partial [Musa banksii]
YDCLRSQTPGNTRRDSAKANVYLRGSNQRLPRPPETEESFCICRKVQSRAHPVGHSTVA